MRVIIGLAALALSASYVAAQPSALHFEPLGLTDGLSNPAVTAVETDAAGFAWFGSTSAVDRFDGVRLRSFGAGRGQEDGYVYALALDADGTLWAGGEGGLWRRPAASTAFSPVPLSRASEVRALVAVRGAVWVGTTGAGLLRIEGGRTRRFTAARGEILSDTVRALAPLRSGALVVATSGGVSWLGGAARPARHDRSLTDVRALAEADGRVWAGRADGQVVAFEDGRSRAVAGAGPGVSVLAPSATYPGRVWVGRRGGGLQLLDARTGRLRPLPPASGLPEPADRTDVLSVAERGGVLWVGTMQGVFYADVSPPRFTAYRGGPDGPLAVPDVIGAHLSPSDPSRVWAGANGGGLYRIDRRTGTAERWFGAPGHPLAVVLDVQEDVAGGVWLASPSPDLWWLRPATGETGRLSLAPNGLVSDLAPSRRFPGHLWVGTDKAGLLRVDTRSRRVVARYATADGPGRLPARDVWQTAEADGALWVATRGDGLWRLDLGSGRAARVVPDGCALGDALLSVAVGARGALWVGDASEGLYRLDRRTGACRAFGTDLGLPADGVGAVFEDRRGHVWAATNQGLFRLDPDAEVVTAFTEADGLAGSALYWYARSQSATGEIAVGGEGGLTVFDPLDVPVDTAAAPVVLTGLAVDGAARPLPGGAFSLPHRQNDVAFEYAALDLRQPAKTRYRVRLRGDSERWEEATAEARYRALAPGRYTFEVRATNRDGYWSAPLSVPFRIRPPFWRTVPFWLAVVGALGAVGYAAHRYRVAQLLRVERTRRRIADDLHDGIGSKISSVALRLDMVGHRDGVPDETRAALETLSRTARSVVGDLRDTVWLVDAEFDDLAAIVSRMEQFAVDTLDGRGSVAAPAAVPPLRLPMEARRDLYLLFTEALHNAVRHASAGHVAVRIEAEPHRVAFAVEDDGVGFDPAHVARGRGLDTMRRRADALGGTLAWAPRPGGGTSVQFSADLG